MTLALRGENKLLWALPKKTYHDTHEANTTEYLRFILICLPRTEDSDAYFGGAMPSPLWFFSSTSLVDPVVVFFTEKLLKYPNFCGGRPTRFSNVRGSWPPRPRRRRPCFQLRREFVVQEKILEFGTLKTSKIAFLDKPLTFINTHSCKRAAKALKRHRTTDWGWGRASRAGHFGSLDMNLIAPWIRHSFSARKLSHPNTSGALILPRCCMERSV